MKYNMIFLRMIFGFLLLGLLTGCVSFKSSKYVGRKQYLLESTKATKKIATLGCMENVFFDHVEAIAPFDQLNFLYRVGPTRYLIDYYNGFLVSPSEQIDSIIEVSYGGLNRDVVKALGYKNRLQVKLTELYADYRDRNNPKAVVALHFVLTKLIDKGGKTKVLLNKVFVSKIPLQEKILTV